MGQFSYMAINLINKQIIFVGILVILYYTYSDIFTSIFVIFSLIFTQINNNIIIICILDKMICNEFMGQFSYMAINLINKQIIFVGILVILYYIYSDIFTPIFVIFCLIFTQINNYYSLYFG